MNYELHSCSFFNLGGKMFLHHNDYVILWINGKIIIAKIRVVGEVLMPNDSRVFIHKTKFYDTQKSINPTIRVWTSIQFQFHGEITPEELNFLRVEVTALNGTSVENCDEFEDEYGKIIEYSGRYPMLVKITNYLNNKRTTFVIKWSRRPHHSSPGDYVFVLNVEGKEEMI